mgnify:CR=1 FL=1
MTSRDLGAVWRKGRDTAKRNHSLGVANAVSSLVTGLSALRSGLFDPSSVHGAQQGSNACGWPKTGVYCSEIDLNGSEIASRLLTREAVLREGGFTRSIGNKWSFAPSVLSVTFRSVKNEPRFYVQSTKGCKSCQDLPTYLPAYRRTRRRIAKGGKNAQWHPSIRIPSPRQPRI